MAGEDVDAEHGLGGCGGGREEGREGEDERGVHGEYGQWMVNGFGSDERERKRIQESKGWKYEW